MWKCDFNVILRVMCVSIQHILPGYGGSHGGPSSDLELSDESTGLHGRLSPRVSLGIAADDDTVLIPKQRKSSKFNIGQSA